LALCSKGSFGWRVKEDSGTLFFSSNIKGFSEKRGTFKNINYLFGMILDNKIDHITYSAKDSLEEHPLNMFTTQDGTRYFYIITDKNLKSVAYTAYSKADKVLYIR